jgi:prepilin-type N-terminal cleavage/methylation domain-containing protein
MKKGRSFRGFTLMEMLIVVAIIAILAAIAIPTFTGSLEKARKATCAANRRSLKGLLTTAYMTDGADAVKSTYSDQKNKFTCPDGGTISYSLDSSTGTVTVTCSKHSDEAATESSVYANLSTYISSDSALFSTLKGGTSVTSAQLSNKTSTAYKWYQTLSASEKSLLSKYSWSIQYSSKNGVRVFFKDASGTVKGVYKYSADKNQYQYNPNSTMDSNCKTTDHNTNAVTWGAYVNGVWTNNQWADTMAEASGQ